MNITTAAIIGGIIVFVFFLALKKRRTVDALMQENVNVVPLLLQKSTQAKVIRLQQATQNDIEASKRLLQLTSAYKGNYINIQQYNNKLDVMITQIAGKL